MKKETRFIREIKAELKDDFSAAALREKGAYDVVASGLRKLDALSKEVSVDKWSNLIEASMLIYDEVILNLIEEFDEDDISKYEVTADAAFALMYLFLASKLVLSKDMADKLENAAGGIVYAYENDADKHQIELIRDCLKKTIIDIYDLDEDDKLFAFELAGALILLGLIDVLDDDAQNLLLENTDIKEASELMAKVFNQSF